MPGVAVEKRDIFLPVDGKSEKEATRLRIEGNAAILSKDLSKALLMYGRSIATAPYDGNTEVLAIAFANRSAVYYFLGSYEDCLSDIEQALKVDYPIRLLSKVLKRRAECYQAMNKMDEARNSYEEAIACCLEEDKKRSMEQELAALKPPEQVYKPRLRVRPPPEKYLGDNPMIPGASACIEIKYNEQYGRHLVATQDIPPGVTLIDEDAFVGLPYGPMTERYCYNCVRRFSPCIPCKSCPRVRYCSEECRDTSWKKVHKLECSLLAELRQSQAQILSVFHLFAVSLIKHGGLRGLFDYVTAVDAEDVKIKGCDANGAYDSTTLRTVLHMQPLPIYNSPEFVVPHRKDCSVIMDILTERTDVFTGQPKELREFAEKLLLQLRKIVFYTPDVDGLVGFVLHPVMMLLNHKCGANVASYNRASRSVVISVRPIAKGDQLFGAYPAFDRQESNSNGDLCSIETLYGFKCGCYICTDPLPPLTMWPICPRCRHPLPRDFKTDNVNCRRCKKAFSAYRSLAVGRQAFNRIQDLAKIANTFRNEANIPSLCELISIMHKAVIESPDIMQNNLDLLLAHMAQSGCYYWTKDPQHYD